MIENKYINHIIVIIMVIASLFISLILLKPDILCSADQSEPEYIQTIFNKEQVSEINIDIDEDDWQYIIDNASQEQYRSCSITINGTTFHNVGIRPKGNSSLRKVLQNDTTDRFSFKVDFDTYIDGQTAFGLDKLCLNNIIQDNSYMKEYLAYEMFVKMGVVTPAYSYANITLNGEPWGLYLAVEDEDKSFVKRVYGNLNGHLYKPEGSGADLVYTGDNSSNYSGIKNGAAYKVSDRDFEKVITMIKNLNEGSDLKTYIDVDTTLRYFAVNTFLVNFDSYQGSLKHNYYLYEEDGVCTILPWDLNLAFTGFGSSSAQDAVNYSIDKPVNGTTLEQRPLLGKLLEVPEYNELYHQYLDELVNIYIDSGLFDETVDKVDRLINSYVEGDVTAFCTYQDYGSSLPVLKNFARLRAQAITAQLAGNNEKIDASSINLRDLGSMGGGRDNNPDHAGLGQPGNMQPPNRDRAVIDRQFVSEDAVDVDAANTEAFQPGAGNPVDRENVRAAMGIIQSAKDGELSQEQITQLKELGFDEEQIQMMLTMPAGRDRPNGGMVGEPPAGELGKEPNFMRNDRDGRPGETADTFSTVQLAYLGGWVGLLLAGLLLAGLFKKRKYRS